MRKTVAFEDFFSDKQIELKDCNMMLPANWAVRNLKGKNPAWFNKAIDRVIEHLNSGELNLELAIAVISNLIKSKPYRPKIQKPKDYLNQFADAIIYKTALLSSILEKEEKNCFYFKKIFLHCFGEIKNDIVMQLILNRKKHKISDAALSDFLLSNPKLPECKSFLKTHTNFHHSFFWDKGNSTKVFQHIDEHYVLAEEKSPLVSSSLAISEPQTPATSPVPSPSLMSSSVDPTKDELIARLMKNNQELLALAQQQNECFVFQNQENIKLSQQLLKAQAWIAQLQQTINFERHNHLLLLSRYQKLNHGKETKALPITQNPINKVSVATQTEPEQSPRGMLYFGSLFRELPYPPELDLNTPSQLIKDICSPSSSSASSSSSALSGANPSG